MIQTALSNSIPTQEFRQFDLASARETIEQRLPEKSKLRGISVEDINGAQLILAVVSCAPTKRKDVLRRLRDLSFELGIAIVPDIVPGVQLKSRVLGRLEDELGKDFSRSDRSRLKYIIKQFRGEYKSPSLDEFWDLRHLPTFSIDSPGTVDREDCIGIDGSSIIIFQPVRNSKLLFPNFEDSYHQDKTVASVGVRVYRDGSRLKVSEPFLALAQNDCAYEFGQTGGCQLVKQVKSLLDVTKDVELVSKAARLFRRGIGEFLSDHRLPIIESEQTKSKKIELRRKLVNPDTFVREVWEMIGDTPGRARTQIFELIGRRHLHYVPSNGEPRIKCKRGDHAIRNNDTVVSAISLLQVGIGLRQLRYSLKQFNVRSERIQTLLDRSRREREDYLAIRMIHKFLSADKLKVQVIGHDVANGNSIVQFDNGWIGTLKNAKPAIGSMLNVKAVAIKDLRIYVDRV